MSGVSSFLTSAYYNNDMGKTQPLEEDKCFFSDDIGNNIFCTKCVLFPWISKKVFCSSFVMCPLQALPFPRAFLGSQSQY
jgi:hypothetical protein